MYTIRALGYNKRWDTTSVVSGLMYIRVVVLCEVVAVN